MVKFTSSAKNNIIVNEFQKLVKQIQFDIDQTNDKKEKLKNMFRLQNINKVLKILEKYPQKITSANQLKGIPGIGKGSLERIEEILKTGKLHEINEDAISNKYLQYLDELEDVFGIGRKLAMELYAKHNIKSIDELKHASELNKIELPENVKKGLKYYDIFKRNINRSEIDEIYNYVSNEIHQIDERLFGTICGSYRRLNPTSNDIDFLLIHPKIKTQLDLKKNKYFKKLLVKLSNSGFIIESFTNFDVRSKFMGLCRLSKKTPVRRIDIRFVPYESYYYSLLYFTGSGEFNRKMRQTAIDNGYILNEYGLYDERKKFISVKSEKEIFDVLSMEYVTPDKRNI